MVQRGRLRTQEVKHIPAAGELGAQLHGLHTSELKVRPSRNVHRPATDFTSVNIARPTDHYMQMIGAGGIIKTIKTELTT